MRRILVIDDDPELLSLVETVLVYAGYSVTLAKDGNEAIAKLDQMAEPPDLIICDILMPVMSGVEFCLWTKSQPGLRLVPFLFLTGLDKEDDFLNVYMIGFDDYLTKPFSAKDLLMRVEVQISRYEPFKMLAESASGSSEGRLKEFPLSRLLQMFTLSGRSGTIELEKDGQKAGIELENGQIVKVDYNALEQQSALTQLLRWQSGKYTVRFK